MFSLDPRVRHSHYALRHLVGFLCEGIAGGADRQLRLHGMRRAAGATAWATGFLAPGLGVHFLEIAVSQTPLKHLRVHGQRAGRRLQGPLEPLRRIRRSEEHTSELQSPMYLV